jgi:uncharacterized protein YozE (UPF0346 family)
VSALYVWLGTQCRRQDDIGSFARDAYRDKTFPRYERHLHIFLWYYRFQPDKVKLVKKVHRAWRQSRKEIAA